MVFGRSKKNNKQGSGEGVDPYAHVSTGKFMDDREHVVTTGPYDVSDQPESSQTEGEYLDFGALRIIPFDAVSIRLEVEEETQRVVAVTFDHQGSSLQLQAFAAPRKEELWPEIKSQIIESVSSQDGSVEEVDGDFGEELVASLPAVSGDGTRGHRVARFVGIDGPRWFLRGVFGGPAATNAADAHALEALLRSAVVVRGSKPMPPRELLSLSIPDQPRPAVPEDEEPAGPKPGERGPEMTEIR